MAQQRVQGEYIFNRQEMVAGFNFLANGRFTFFFSYGAVDRIATGKFAVHSDTLTLKSDKEAGKDFTITSQAKAAGGYYIKFEDPNKYLLSNIRCTFFIGDEKHDEFTNESGEIHIDSGHVDKIYVQHTLFPDIVTMIKDEKNENTSFILILNPSLAQVSFKGIYFKVEDDRTISCMPNYFMMMEDIKFNKQEK